MNNNNDNMNKSNNISNITYPILTKKVGFQDQQEQKISIIDPILTKPLGFWDKQQQQQQ